MKIIGNHMKNYGHIILTAHVSQAIEHMLQMYLSERKWQNNFPKNVFERLDKTTCKNPLFNSIVLRRWWHCKECLNTTCKVERNV